MIMAFQDKFALLPGIRRQEILTHAKRDAWGAAKAYAPESGMGERSLYRRLVSELRKEGIIPEAKTTVRKSGKEKVPEVEIELTEEESKFLEGLSKGTVSLEEASRIVARKVFEKMLRSPKDIRFDNFFKTELLKIKQTETADKQNYMQTLLNRMFSGALPPRHCPQCGYEVIKIQEGEVVNVESLPASGDI